jgi:hypothetical protein
MAGFEEDAPTSEPATPAEPTQALAVVPPVSQTASPMAPVRPYIAIAAGVVLVGIAIAALLTTRSSARESLPSNRAATGHAVTPDAASSIPRTHASVLPHWSNANQARWVSNYRKSVAFELAADHDVPVWMRRVQPLLVVRCLAHKADVFVFTDSPARIEPEDENHSVRVAFDNEAEATERWMDSEEHDALFAPDGASFARRLAQSHTLRFGFTPHNAAPVTVQFTTSGFDKVLDRVAEKCRM